MANSVPGLAGRRMTSCLLCFGTAAFNMAPTAASTGATGPGLGVQLNGLSLGGILGVSFCLSVSIRVIANTHSGILLAALLLGQASCPIQLAQGLSANLARDHLSANCWTLWHHLWCKVAGFLHYNIVSMVLLTRRHELGRTTGFLPSPPPSCYPFRHAA